MILFRRKEELISEGSAEPYIPVTTRSPMALAVPAVASSHVIISLEV